MSFPQFPNTFYGHARVNGLVALSGLRVTAVVDRGLSSERHYMLPVFPKGRFGSGNGAKLKVGGDHQGNIEHMTRIEFFVTSEDLPQGTTLPPAGHHHFMDDRSPHVTMLTLCQD